MDKYRKLPVVIEAVQVLHANRAEIEALGENVGTLDVDPTKNYDFHVEIETLEGTMRGDYRDWIIRGVSGELYPCKDSIFRKTYEPATT